MVLEVVGEAFLSASFEVLFRKMASMDIVGSIWGKKHSNNHERLMKELLMELKIMLLSANAVVNDAEEKQLGNPFVRSWLHELQAAVYDAEDLVQIINTETLRYKIEAEHGSSSCSSSSNQAIIEQVESKMREIIETLKLILAQKVHLGLKEEGSQNISSKSRKLPPATSFVDESSVYGRNKEKEDIIKSLLTTEEGNDDKFSVITIVGMGGIGKTTLAQLVYNDEKVKQCFGFRVWVSVSNEFDIFKITKIIADRVTNSQTFHHSHDDLDLLQEKLREALEAKMFLLVLDDVWNEDYFQWEELKKPFESGAFGSKIIVTTRNENVALVMRNNNTPSYHIRTMSDENCWKLFVKHAFNNVYPCGHPRLAEIGRQIVHKCKGLPLAVKSLGSILRYQLILEEWEAVLKSDMWDLPKQKNNILPALWLSYHYLPSYLKRCFAFCSLIPKNYEIDKDDLIKLWMAEDLLESQNNKRIERVGEEYFDELLSRSLFQKSDCYYTMHDLVHDLATFVVGDFCLRLIDNNSYKCLNKVRYLSLPKEKIHSLEKYTVLFEAKYLRTFFLPSILGGGIQIQLESLGGRMLWSKLTCLRSLSLRGCYSIRKLSDSIGNLKLLRYLNLSRTQISDLPITVCSLYNLQTLNLSCCKKLKMLPTQIGRLINLRHLDIKKTAVERMPFKMGSLKDLQTLSDFVVGKYSGYTICLIENFQHLHGRLEFRGLENVLKVEDALQANLKEKKNLNKIKFRWLVNDKSGDNSHKDVLDALEPPTSLKHLTISSYGGEKCPNWVGHPSFWNLESINLEGCRECKMLPPLGQLPILKNLTISGFDELVKAGNEFYGTSCSMPNRPFRCLKSLLIRNMKKCEEWSFFEEDGNAAFPELETFKLVNCPRLKAHICFPNTITKVEIDGCKMLELSGLQQQQKYYENSGEELCVLSCEFVTGSNISLDYFPMFTSLRLIHCSNLKSLISCQQLALKRINISYCNDLESFPKGGLHAPNLTELYVGCCKKLRSLPEQMQALLPSLKILYLTDCTRVESLPESPMPSNLRQLDILRCNKLLASRRNWCLQSLVSLTIEGNTFEDEVMDSFPEEGLLPATLVDLYICSRPLLRALNGKALQHLSSLKQLKISCCEELQCLAEDGVLPPNLIGLHISWLPLLKALDGKALQHLSSLQALNISFCPQLQCFPEEPLPVSLSELHINRCPILTQRCQRQTGQDWPKISHIPRITIDGHVI